MIEIERRLLMGRGSWDEGREKWEGEAPAEPIKAANSDWRIANGERRTTSSEW